MTSQGPGPGPKLESKGKGFCLLPEGVGPGDVRLQQWAGHEVSLRPLVTFLLPSGQSHPPEDERALLSPGVESARSCRGPGAPPET